MIRTGRAGPVWMGLLAIVLVLGPGPWPATADNHCQVQISRGWSGGNGTGTMVMRNDDKPCTGILYSVPEDRLPVETIQAGGRGDGGPDNVTLPTGHLHSLPSASVGEE